MHRGGQRQLETETCRRQRDIHTRTHLGRRGSQRNYHEACRKWHCESSGIVASGLRALPKHGIASSLAVCFAVHWMTRAARLSSPFWAASQKTGLETFDPRVRSLRPRSGSAGRHLGIRTRTSSRLVPDPCLPVSLPSRTSPSSGCPACPVAGLPRPPSLPAPARQATRTPLCSLSQLSVHHACSP